MNAPTFIPYQIDVHEVNGLTFIFSPKGLDILVTDRAAFEAAYAETSGHSRAWTDDDILAEWLEPFRANGIAQYYYDIAGENLALGWLTNADAIYHEDFQVAYVNESYAIRGVLANLTLPANWDEALARGRFDSFYLPGYDLDYRWLSGELNDAAYRRYSGEISEAEYQQVLANTFGDDYATLFEEGDND